MPDSRNDALKKLSDAATKGEWAVYEKGSTLEIGHPENLGQRPCIVGWAGFDSCDKPMRERRANARLIVALVNAYRAGLLSTSAPCNMDVIVSHERHEHLLKCESLVSESGRGDTAKDIDYKILWERDSAGLGKCLQEVHNLRAVKEDQRARIAVLEGELADLRSNGGSAKVPEVVDTWVELPDGKLSPSNGGEDSPDWTRYVVLYEQDWLEFTKARCTGAVQPEGWKLVPLEPTPEMRDAMLEADRAGGWQLMYKAMLAAAPSAPEEKL